MKGMFKETLRIFLPLALGLSALLLVSYVNEQQLLRLAANEPQKGMAEDAAQQISDEPTGTYVVPPGETVSIGTSLSPYLVVYDSYGKPVTGTGYLDGLLPSIPPGIFDTARSKGEDTLTWQPEKGVRSAIVVVAVSGGAGGFVMGGRSLSYVEQQEMLLDERILLGWVVVLLAAALGSFLTVYLRRRG